jgi:cytochrome d ubiquinol oxidase subunit II
MPLLQPAFRERWFDFPSILLAAPVPIFVALLAWRFFGSLAESRRRSHAGLKAKDRQVLWHDGVPFLCALGLFLLSYIGLGISMWPFVVPPAVTIWDAAASPSSQRFLLVGAAVLIPVILAYTGYVYWLFRGKVRAGEGYH